MSVGSLILVFQDAIVAARDLGVLHPDGTFSTPSAEQDIAFAAAVEKSLKLHGVDIPAKVDKVVKLLPLIFELVS
jgi:hypothetical protein